MKPTERLVASMKVAELAEALGITISEMVDRASTPRPVATATSSSDVMAELLKRLPDGKTFEASSALEMFPHLPSHTVYNGISALIVRGKLRRLARGVYQRAA